MGKSGHWFVIPNKLVLFLQTFEATSWEMSIDFEMDYSSDMAAYSKSSYQIYFAAHVPEALRRKDYKDFG